TGAGRAQRGARVSGDSDQPDCAIVGADVKTAAGGILHDDVAVVREGAGASDDRAAWDGQRDAGIHGEVGVLQVAVIPGVGGADGPGAGRAVSVDPKLT